MNADGKAAKAGELGLLLYNGGTVCNDGFADNAAKAICVELGFKGATGWRSLKIRSNYDIKLDEVHCMNTFWVSCVFLTTHDCSHYQDVFLECHSDEGTFNYLTIL